MILYSCTFSKRELTKQFNISMRNSVNLITNTFRNAKRRIAIEKQLKAQHQEFLCQLGTHSR